ncbi:hypothetical protein MMA231_00329 [Asticcacaulis sp. MM231]|uniref:hypothetical protein n=1 Tax=Asticcacaulis sp. MM231 TaxID=3157666 RepID=UPI0032D5AD8C
MRIAAVLFAMLALSACSEPAEPEPQPVSVAAPPPVIDLWPGKYEGDLMVRINGTLGAHKVTLVAAQADGCTGDIGLAGGEPAKDVSPTELSLTLKPADTTTCTIRIVKTGDKLTVSEQGVCTTYHGLSCTFDGTAVRMK